MSAPTPPEAAEEEPATTLCLLDLPGARGSIL
jgi:hypothetical protein